MTLPAIEGHSTDNPIDICHGPQLVRVGAVAAVLVITAAGAVGVVSTERLE